MSAPNSRLWDDSVFLPAGAPIPAPHSLGALLVELNLFRASDAEKRAGIAVWLAENVPSDSLTRSLERNGYGDLVRTRRVG